MRFTIEINPTEWESLPPEMQQTIGNQAFSHGCRKLDNEQQKIEHERMKLARREDDLGMWRNIYNRGRP